jgi:hypothetical protein
LPDFTTYQPPGVFVEEDATPLVAPTGTTPTVVGIVGPAVGYRVATETITLVGTNQVQLGQLGINPAAGFSMVGSDGTVYPASAYSLTVGPGADAQAGTTPDNTLSVARNGAAIPDGSVVHVTYRYTDASYNAPQRFQDYDDVKDWFGNPFDTTTGAITSPLTLAAQIAFSNGASTVVLVATTGTATAVTRQQLADAYAKLTAVSDVDVIVPLPVGIAGTAGAPADVPTVAADLKGALDSAANDALYRVALLGYDAGTTDIDPLTIAGAADDRRVAVVWPNRVSYYNGYTNQTIEVGGYYLAAAAAGVLARQNVQEPLTKKQVRGFSGLPASTVQAMTTATKNAWSSGGLMVVEITRDGRMVIRHGTTTDRSSVITRELSLVRARDALVQLIDQTTDRAQLIGSTIDENTPIAIKGVIAGCLETAVGAGIIVAYTNLKVRQTSTDPSVIEVKFAYQPAYPLNYIVVSFAIDVTTGENTLAA